MLLWNVTNNQLGYNSSNTNEPSLIEANMNFGGYDIPQIANGPLFGDYTKQMIKEVLSNKKNKYYRRYCFHRLCLHKLF